MYGVLYSKKGSEDLLKKRNILNRTIPSSIPSKMRALFRPFALHAAYTPIETIVFFSIIGTLAYFNILSAIRNSAFLNLDPALLNNNYDTVKPAYVMYRLGEWVSVRESVWVHANVKDEPVLELQQLVFAIDSAQKVCIPKLCINPYLMLFLLAIVVPLDELASVVNGHTQLYTPSNSRALFLSVPPIQ